MTGVNAEFLIRACFSFMPRFHRRVTTCIYSHHGNQASKHSRRVERSRHAKNYH